MPLTKFTGANLKKMKKDDLIRHIIDCYSFIDVFDDSDLIKKLKKENEELKKFKENTEEMCGAFAVTEELMKKNEKQEEVMKRQRKEIEQLQQYNEQLKYNFDVTQETLDEVSNKYSVSKMDTYETDCNCGCDDLRIRINKQFIIDIAEENEIFVNEDEKDDFTEVVGEHTILDWEEYVDMDKLKEQLKDHIIGINRLWEGSDSEEEA